MKAPYTEEQFAEHLKAINLTLDDVKHDLRRSLTIDKLLNKEINSKVTVSDADITNYYNQHKAEFDLIETQYHLAAIRVTSVPSPQPGNLQGSKATTDAEAKKKIEALKNRLDSGEDFGTIAMNFSEDPSTASSGGDMGFVPESQLRGDPTVGAAILKLKPGQMTDIFPLIDAQSKKAVGYTIYKLLERSRRAARDLRSCGATAHPPTAPRWAIATAEGRIFRVSARPGQGGKLLCRRDPEERREVVSSPDDAVSLAEAAQLEEMLTEDAHPDGGVVIVMDMRRTRRRSCAGSLLAGWRRV